MNNLILIPELNKIILSYLAINNESLESKLESKINATIKSNALDTMIGFYSYGPWWRITSPIISDDITGAPKQSISVDKIDFERELDSIFYFNHDERHHDMHCVVVGKLKTIYIFIIKQIIRKVGLIVATGVLFNWHIH